MSQAEIMLTTAYGEPTRGLEETSYIVKKYLLAESKGIGKTSKGNLDLQRHSV